jgi:prepilin-type N-terminal cleavage/methylation domain-containing protein
MSSKQLLSNDSGFTIIEALIALAIFSIGLMAMGALQARSLMDTGDVARKTEAWTIADEQATLLKEMPFMNTATWTVPAALTAGNQQVTHPNGRYDVHWRVRDDIPIGVQPATLLPGVPAGNWTVSKEITVSVTPVGGSVPNDTIAEVQFYKTWWATGCP